MYAKHWKTDILFPKRSNLRPINLAGCVGRVQFPYEVKSVLLFLSIIHSKRQASPAQDCSQEGMQLAWQRTTNIIDSTSILANVRVASDLVSQLHIPGSPQIMLKQITPTPPHHQLQLSSVSLDLAGLPLEWRASAC